MEFVVENVEKRNKPVSRQKITCSAVNRHRDKKISISDNKNLKYKSPYESTLHLLGTNKSKKSVTMIRSKSVGLMKRPVQRKNSEPELTVSNTIQKNYKSAPPIPNKANIRRKVFSKATLGSFDSEKSTENDGEPHSEPGLRPKVLSTNGKTCIKKKRLPFSFSSSFKEGQREPVLISPIGDVRGYQVKEINDSPPKRVSFEVNNGAGDGFLKDSDDLSPSIQFKMFEHPEQCLLDRSYTQTIQTNEMGNNFDPEINSSSISTQSAEVRKNKDDKQYYTNSSTNASAKISPQENSVSVLPQMTNVIKSKQGDELMIEKTDDLILEVAKFITQIKLNRVEHFATDNSSTAPDVSPSPINYSESFKDVSNFFDTLRKERDKTREESPLRVASITDHDTCTDFNKIKISQPINHLEKPSGLEEEEGQHIPISSARSMSNKDIHNRICQTLKMIEQEEENDILKKSPTVEDFEPISSGRSTLHLSNCASHCSNSNPPSRPCSSLSYQSSCPYQISKSPRDYIHPIIPKTDIDSSVNNFYADSVRSNSSCTNFKIEIHQSQENPQKCQSYKKNSHALNPAADLWQPTDEKTKKIFSFLDEVERSDQEALFVLKYDPTSSLKQHEERIQNVDDITKSRKSFAIGNAPKTELSSLKIMDSLIRKGPVELAREHIILDRQLEEANHRTRVLEETMIHQRELNMRNLRNSEKDMKKRLKLQKEEFDMAFSRNEALINEMAAEKRILQERCDKLIRSFDETESKYKEQIKSLQQKHLEEIKRLRKVHLSAENVRKQQWVGNKTQEIKELTVKGLEPEVQRIITRHQQEMSEMRAWHSDEIREIENRYQRKINMQAQEIREKFNQELEDAVAHEKETAIKKLEAEMKQREEEHDTHKRRLTSDLYEERDRATSTELKLKELMQENVRKAQIKGEMEVENLKQEFEAKLNNLERKHENELKSLKDIQEAEKDSWMNNYLKKYEQGLKDREKEVVECKRLEMEKELREKEKQLREEFEKIRKEDEEMVESRIKRGQEKFQSELEEMDKREIELKSKLNQAKSELLSLEEQIFTLRTAISHKDKQNDELQESNHKMLEERSNLTSVIRREFSAQMETLEEEVQSVKTTLVNLQTKHKLELEQRQVEINKIYQEKDIEIEKIALRVQQTIARKEETIQELQKQLEKANFQIQHLEGLLEEQRKDLIDSMTRNSSAATKRK